VFVTWFFRLLCGVFTPPTITRPTHTLFLLIFPIPYITISYICKISREELSLTLRARVWERYDCTKNVLAIALHFKQLYSTVSSLINRLKKQDKLDFYSKPRSGALKVTNDRQDRALVRYAVANLKCPFKLLATPSKSSVKLGRNTIRKILKEYRKSKRVPRKKP